MTFDLTTRLALLGDASPVAASTLDDEARASGVAWPREIRALFGSWGPGSLADVFELFDPRAGGYRSRQAALRAEAHALRVGGYWSHLTPGRFASMLFLGEDRRGAMIVAQPEAPDLVLLLPSGHAIELASLGQLVEDYLLGGLVDRTRADVFTRTDRWEYIHEISASPMGTTPSWARICDQGIPAVYRVASRSPRSVDAFSARLAAGDEPGADLELEGLLSERVAIVVLFEALHELAGPKGTVIVPQLRRDTFHQLLRMVKRRAPFLAERLPVAMFDGALSAGHACSDEVLAVLRENEVLEPAHGPFKGGDEETSEVIVSSEEVDFEGRGFLCPPGAEVVIGDVQIAAHAQAWRIEALDVNIDAIVERAAALDRGVRQGCSILVARLGHCDSADEVDRHLLREMSHAWPLLVLALRAPYDWDWLAQHTRTRSGQLLARANVVEAAPYLLSVLRRPSDRTSDSSELADAYAALVRPDRKLVDELVPYLATPSNPNVPPELLALHGPDPNPIRLADVAARLLVAFADDERVFLGYLGHFGDTHPFSSRALAKRLKDPRVIPSLWKQLEVERNRALGRRAFSRGKYPEYSDGFGVLARTLAKLGDPRGVAAANDYRTFIAWFRKQPI